MIADYKFCGCNYCLAIAVLCGSFRSSRNIQDQFAQQQIATVRYRTTTCGNTRAPSQTSLPAGHQADGGMTSFECRVPALLGAGSPESWSSAALVRSGRLLSLASRPMPGALATVPFGDRGRAACGDPVRPVAHQFPGSCLSLREAASASPEPRRGLPSALSGLSRQACGLL